MEVSHVFRFDILYRTGLGIKISLIELTVSVEGPLNLSTGMVIDSLDIQNVIQPIVAKWSKSIVEIQSKEYMLASIAEDIPTEFLWSALVLKFGYTQITLTRYEFDSCYRSRKGA